MTRYPARRTRDGHLLVLDAATSRRMAGIRQVGTAPELAVRRALARLGLRYRVKNRDLPGSPDLANRSRRWAIFVHGCYWHRHSGCKRATTPSRNRAFWVDKFTANVQRDERALALLREMGYSVLVVWECEAELTDTLTLRLRAWLGAHGITPGQISG